MAINLNPGADATLVTAATRAGLAGAPADYSTTFENVAKSYEKTMEAQGEMWKNIGNVVGIVGADMVANAQEFMDYRIRGGALNPDSAKVLVNELDANKQAQKVLGLFPGVLGDKETRQRKRELKLEQTELFAEIDMAAESINAGAEAVAAGLFDFKLAANDGEMINAIIKSNLKDKVTIAKNTAVLSRDEKTDELIFTLLGPDGKPRLNAANEPTTMSIKEFNKSIATNVKDTQNIMGGALNTLNDNTANSGAKSTNGVYDPQMKQAALNQLDSLLNTSTDLKRAMMTTFGYSNTSFYDDIGNPGTFSEDLYVTLVKTIGKTEGGQVKAEGALEGIADTDGILGLSQKEISNNYAILSANILGLKDPEVSKAYFKEYTTNKLKEAYEYGYSKRTIPTGTGTGSGDGTKTETNPYGIPKDGLKLGDMIDGRYQIPVRQDRVTGYINDIKSGSDFKFMQNNYSYEDGNWYENYGTKPNEDGEGGEFKFNDTQAMTDDVFQTGGKYFDGLETVLEFDPETGKEYGKTEEVVKGTQSSFSPSINMELMDKEDNLIVDDLQVMMPTIFSNQNPNGYKFKTLKSMFQKIGLYDNDNNIIKYPEGHPKEGDDVIIYTGGDIERRMAAIATLDDILNTKEFGIKGFGGGGKYDD